MSDGPGTDFVEMTLGNVADGELQTQFLEELQKVMDVKGMLHAYRAAGNTVSCKITMDAEFTFHLETGAILVSTTANFKPPKRKGVARAVFMRDGVTLVEDAIQQSLLDDGNVRSIESAKNGDERK